MEGGRHCPPGRGQWDRDPQKMYHCPTADFARVPHLLLLLKHNSHRTGLFWTKLLYGKYSRCRFGCLQFGCVVIIKFTEFEIPNIQCTVYIIAMDCIAIQSGLGICFVLIYFPNSIQILTEYK